MRTIEEKAEEILREFKGDTYAFGSGVLDEKTGTLTAQMGRKAMVVGSVQSEWFQPVKERILRSLDIAGVEVVNVARSAAPNAPFVDVY